MVDSSGAPRRVSMAYILGFSSKPFKDGGPPAPPPAPRHPSAFKQMVTTPGGVIEWTASDGRRGRLTGPGKPRLTATSLAHVPDAKTAGANASSKKDVAEGEGDIFGVFLAEGASTGRASVKGAGDTKPSDSNWTKDQDEKLMELKAENKPWADIATETNMKEYECKDRFKQIRPKDWKPNNAKGGGGGNQKQNKKGKKGQINQQDGGNDDGEKKDGVADGGFDQNAWPGGSGAAPDNGSGNNNAADVFNNESGWGFEEKNSGDNKAVEGFGNNKNDGWGGSGGNTNGNHKDDGGFGNDTSGWEATPDNSGGDNQQVDGFDVNKGDGWGASGDSGATGEWQNSNGDGNDAWDNNKTGGDDATGGGWGGWASKDNNDNSASKDDASKKPPSNRGSASNKADKDLSNKAPSNKAPSNKAPSNKAPSQSGSKRHSSRNSEKPTTAAPKEYELRPDSTFSADDLRLVAKILQQDCSMVWNRVSWRFRDKTGRNLHPDVFEKKITGKAGDRGSERERS